MAIYLETFAKEILSKRQRNYFLFYVDLNRYSIPHLIQDVRIFLSSRRVSKFHTKTVWGPQNLPKDQRYPNSLNIRLKFLMGE